MSLCCYDYFCISQCYLIYDDNDNTYFEYKDYETQYTSFVELYI